jgi:hypothetical protein
VRIRRLLARLGRREDLVPLRVHVLVLLGHGVRVLEVAVPVDRPVDEFVREGIYRHDGQIVCAAVPLVRNLIRALHVLGEVLALLLPREALLLLALAPGRLVGLSPCHAHDVCNDFPFLFSSFIPSGKKLFSPERPEKRAVKNVPFPAVLFLCSQSKQSMSKEAGGNGACAGSSLTVAKRQCTQSLAKQTAASGYHVQVFLNGKKDWNSSKDTWQFIDGQYYNVKISEEQHAGLNILPSRSADSMANLTIFPYGQHEMKCTGRDGCGGIVKNGHALQWKCGSLLHYECGPIAADVMVVCIDSKQAVDAGMDVEQCVRAMFFVGGDDVISEPCWKVGSMEGNELDMWKSYSNETSKQALQQKLDFQNVQLQQKLELKNFKEQTEAQVANMQESMGKMHEANGVYKKAIDQITDCVKCTVCHDLLSDTKASHMAPCGHLYCDFCFNGYFSTLGHSDPACSECRQAAPENSYKDFRGFTGVVAALRQADTLHV